MGTTRFIYCSACGRKLQIPAAAKPGRKVRCRACEHIFLIPRPVAAGPEKENTSVSSFDIADLPPELQDMIKQRQASDGKRPRFPTITEPGALGKLPAALIDAEKAANRAFDLGKSNRPDRRTGAGVIDISHLDLDWLDLDPPKPGPKEEG